MAALLVFFLAYTAGCNTDEDCNLNGVCSSGTCICVPEWTGTDCGVLNLEPARYDAGYNEPGTSSWGGSMVADPSDSSVYHMFVAKMEGQCGLESWTTNSVIIHATARDPVGPYEYKSTVMPHFAHGPSVRKLPDGSYFMMHLGCGEPFAAYCDKCTNGTTPQSCKHHHLSNAAPCNQFNVSILTAKSLYGPWNGAPIGGGTQVFLRSGDAVKSWFVPSGRQFSNPAPHINPDGSLLCAFRADSRSGGEHVSIAKASSLISTYTDNRLSPAINHTSEDPFLWKDERGHWHLLMHNMNEPGFPGSHAYSRDAMTWVRSSTYPYTGLVTFADGSTKLMNRRERPQLLLSEGGRPLYFSSGVQEGPLDHSYTLVMKVKK